jgi:hypothetical protein
MEEERYALDAYFAGGAENGAQAGETASRARPPALAADPPTLQLQSGPGPQQPRSVVTLAEEVPLIVGGAVGPDHGMTQIDPPTFSTNAAPGNDGATTLHRSQLRTNSVRLGQEQGGAGAGDSMDFIPWTPAPAADGDEAAPATGDRLFTDAPAAGLADARQLATPRSLHREADEALAADLDDGVVDSSVASVEATMVFAIERGLAEGRAADADDRLLDGKRSPLRRELAAALAALEAADPESRPALFDALRARCLHEVVQDARLQAWLAGRLLRWAPDDLDLLEARGHALLALGQRAAAWRALSGLVEARPDDPQAHARYARGLFRLGLSDAALVELAEAARLAPAEPGYRQALERAAAQVRDQRSREAAASRAALRAR